MLDSDLFVEPKELLEVKRVQIRAGRANEAVLVKRLAERLQRDLDRQGVSYFCFFFYIYFVLIFYLLVQARVENTILMNYSSGLFRVAGLRSYQGEFTFSGLEDHLFSELRRFRRGKDEVPEELHFLVFVDFLFKRLFLFVISFCTFQPAFTSSTSRLSREFSSSEKR